MALQSGATQDVGRTGIVPLITTHGITVMDRRTFIQSLSCLGATAALPAFAYDRKVRQLALLDDEIWVPGSAPRIGVIAVGGAGGKILSDLYGKLPYLSRSIAIDINRDDLLGTTTDRKILIGGSTNRPRDASTARLLATAARAEIADAVSSLDIAFVVSGMSGIAGTAISPIVAALLKERQTITIAAAFTPVNSEGHRRHQIAMDGIVALGGIANTTFHISNDVLCWQPCQRDLPMGSSPATTTFERLYRGITAPIASPDYLVGFNTGTLRECMSNEGAAAIGYGSASGRNAGEAATRKAIYHPLLGEDQLSSASSVWVLIEGVPELLRTRQFVEISSLIREFVGTSTAVADPVYICGAIRNKTMQDDFRVTILASGIPSG